MATKKVAAEKKDTAKKVVSKKIAKEPAAAKEIKKKQTIVATPPAEKIMKLNKVQSDRKDEDSDMRQEEGRMSFDLDDDVVPVDDDGSDDDVMLEVRKKEISKT